MKADDIDIAVDGILVRNIRSVILSRTELYIVDCEVSLKLQVVVDQLLEYVFFQSGPLLPKRIVVDPCK